MTHEWKTIDDELTQACVKCGLVVRDSEDADPRCGPDAEPTR